MTFYARLFALALLATLASGLDDWSLFCCPSDQRDEADDSVSYDNIVSIAALSAKFLAGGPYKVIAGAESKDARGFSCIELTPRLLNFGITYFEDGIGKTASLTWDPLAAVLKGTLPEGLLNSPDDDTEVEFTVTSYKDGFVVLKTCKNGFMSKYVATYILVDNSVDTTALDMDCVAPLYDVQCKIETWPKGVCS